MAMESRELDGCASGAMTYSVLLEGPEATVCAQAPASPVDTAAYQSEAELERALIDQLVAQGYGRLTVHDEAGLVANLRERIEELNGFRFADADWDAFFREHIANGAEGIVEKTRRIQNAPIIDFQMADGT